MTVSNARREAYLRAIALGMTKTLAADAAGVDRTTPYKWMEDAAFAERVADAEGQFLQRHFGVVTKAAAEGEWRASVWLLSINRPAECSTKRVELTGANGGPVRTVLVDELGAASDEALRSLVTAATVVAEPKP